MLFATLLFAVMQVLVKLLNGIPFYQIIFFRAIISFVFAYYTIRKGNLSLFGNNVPLLILRGVFGVASLSCFFYALHRVPLGTVITIVNIKPFLVLMLAFLFLKERFYFIQLIFFAISFIGIFIIKGFDPDITWGNLAAVLGAAFFAACAHTCVRKLKDTDQPIVIVFYFTFITLPIYGSITAFNWIAPTFEEWVMLISVGIITHFAQLLLTTAYQHDNVAKVSNIYYLGIVFAFAFGYLFFGELISYQSGIGLALVLAGILLNLLFKPKKV